MGNRLHVAKKHEVSWAYTPEHFNWQQEEFEMFLFAMEIDVGGEVYSDFDIPKDQWIEGMGKLEDDRNLDPEIIEALQKLNVEPLEMAGIMRQYLEAADPGNDYLYFSFF